MISCVFKNQLYCLLSVLEYGAVLGITISHMLKVINLMLCKNVMSA